MERPIRRSACGNQPDRQGHNRRHPQDPKRAQRAFEIGQAVRERRLAFGLSQVELASRAGMTQPALSRLEAGGVIPTIPLLERISAALDAASSSRSRHTQPAHRPLRRRSANSSTRTHLLTL